MKTSTKRDTYVIVTVDTVNINTENKNEMVEFSDNRGDPPSVCGNPKEFVATVDRGKKIIWIGIAKDSDDYFEHSVAIKKISRKLKEGGSDILKNKTYEDKNNNGVVVGKIKDKDESGTESYDITILVNGTISFTIDPKLRMT